MRTGKDAQAFGFTGSDRRKLARAMKGAVDRSTFVRLQALYEIASGRSVREVAMLRSLSVQSLYGWIKRYLQHHQPAALYTAPRSGRPLTGSNLPQETILELINTSPLSFGYLQTSWTVALLKEHLAAVCHIDISVRTLRRRMKDMGLRYKRPRYFYSEKEPNRAQKKGLSSES